MQLCGRCKEKPQRAAHRWCGDCHNGYMREWRKTHPMSPEQRKKDAARSYAGVYKRRGKLLQKPCETCGNPESEMHHEDHAKPLEVTWLCRPCHIALHHSRGERI